MTRREQNFKKHPHTARLLMRFHTGGADLPTEIDPGTGAVIDDGKSTDRFATAQATLVSAPAAVIEDVPVDRRSAKQAELMASLLTQLGEIDDEAFQVAAHYVAAMTVNGRWTAGRTGSASLFITETIAQIKALRAAKRDAPAASASTDAVDEGMYMTPDGKIFKVQIAHHGSGRPYAKRLIPGKTLAENGGVAEAARWQYVAGAIRELRPEHKMSKEQAQVFGKLYGVCCRCGIILTHEESIEAGIGPDCAKKY